MLLLAKVSFLVTIISVLALPAAAQRLAQTLELPCAVIELDTVAGDLETVHRRLGWSWARPCLPGEIWQGDEMARNETCSWKNCATSRGEGTF